MCPTCDGQSVADSDSRAARGVRTYIDGRLADGAGDDQVRDELAGRFRPGWHGGPPIDVTTIVATHGAGRPRRAQAPATASPRQ